MNEVNRITELMSESYKQGYKAGSLDANTRIPGLMAEIHDKVAEEMYQRGIAAAAKYIANKCLVFDASGNRITEELLLLQMQKIGDQKNERN